MVDQNAESLMRKVDGVLKVTKSGVEVLDEKVLRERVIDELIIDACLGGEDVQDAARWIIWESALSLGIVPSSIQGLYEARGKNAYSKMTVPAVNIRGLTYDVARALIRAGLKNNSTAFIFEIAKSEISYTFQRPAEYTTLCLAAAIKEGLKGPMFVQGDHCQVSSKKYAASPKEEVEGLKKLIKEEIEGGFYNIDIDTSTVVDLSKPTVDEQQRLNFELAAEFTDFIRKSEPKGVTVSVGGEIGEVGKKNSTPEEYRAYMKGYLAKLKEYNPKHKGISKMSIQTGTTHGGVPLADGKVAAVNLDFGALETIGKIAREEYGIGGVVQHGASTLPAEAFHRFPETETLEVHLATEFQNMIYESKNLPKDLRDKMYKWLHENCAADRKPDMTEEQFIYKTRKKGFGPFKKELMNLPEATRQALRNELEAKFDFLFKKLACVNTAELIKKYIKPVVVHKVPPGGLVK